MTVLYANASDIDSRKAAWRLLTTLWLMLLGNSGMYAVSVVLPTVQAAGIDLIWFGVYMVLMVEMSMVTPPVGLNLFIMQMMSGRSLAFVSKAVFPFFLIMVAFVIVLVAVPGLATYLPSLLF